MLTTNQPEVHKLLTI